MSQSSTNNPAAHNPIARTPTRLLQAVAALLILILLAGDMIVLSRLREDTLLGTEKQMSAIALTLAEQADRAVQGTKDEK
jgi:hypothetical protein